MGQVTIRKALVEDIATLQVIGRRTFYETFAPHNTEEDIQKYLDESFTYEKVKREVDNLESQFFIAWDEETPIGYLKVNTGTAQTELKDETALEIERIYVLAEYHGKKAGQLLYEKALETALQYKKASIWLGVWEENKRAIRFYQKNGFVPFDKHIFRLGDDEQTDIMMRKALE
jgi:ribosomal protein S18 acetylase RimI-like enzyme